MAALAVHARELRGGQGSIVFEAGVRSGRDPWRSASGPADVGPRPSSSRPSPGGLPAAGVLERFRIGARRPDRPGGVAIRRPRCSQNHPVPDWFPASAPLEETATGAETALGGADIVGARVKADVVHSRQVGQEIGRTAADVQHFQPWTWLEQRGDVAAQALGAHQPLHAAIDQGVIENGTQAEVIAMKKEPLRGSSCSRLAFSRRPGACRCR